MVKGIGVSVGIKLIIFSLLMDFLAILPEEIEEEILTYITIDPRSRRLLALVCKRWKGLVGVGNNTVCEYAAEKGYIEMLQWAMSCFEYDRNNLLRVVVRAGKVDVLRYLAPDKDELDHVKGIACRYNQIDVVKWLLNLAPEEIGYCWEHGGQKIKQFVWREVKGSNGCIGIGCRGGKLYTLSQGYADWVGNYEVTPEELSEISCECGLDLVQARKRYGEYGCILRRCYYCKKYYCESCLHGNSILPICHQCLKRLS